MEKKESTITIRIDTDEYTKLRIKLITEGKSISQWVRDKVKEEISSQ